MYPIMSQPRPLGQKSGLTNALVHCHRFRPFGIKRGLRIFWVDMLQGDLFGDMFFVVCCLFLCVWLFICFFVSSRSYVPCSIVAPVLVDTVLCYRGMCLFICSCLFVRFMWIYLICSGRRVLDCCLDAFCICLEALSCHFWGWLFWRHVGKSNEFVKEQTFARESSACWTYEYHMIYPMIICLGGSPTFGGDLQPLQTHPTESPATSFPCGPITNTWVVSLHLKG